jgi:hypothetical protein
MTTPYTLGGRTKEHFPELNEFTLASLGGKTVLVNRRRDGSIETFQDLVFHGGPGSTVEMRVFTEESLRANLLETGFTSVRVASENVPEFGIEHAETWSLPIIARKQSYRAPVAELSREYIRARRQATHLEQEIQKLQSDYDNYVKHHEAWSKQAKQDLAERFEWGSALDRELTARTEWAQGLDREIAELRARLEKALAEKARMDASKWTRLGRKLRAIE